jgi:hypothetical protein
MEGGKIMRTRLVFKSIFTIILIIILVGLIFIIYDKTGTSAHIYDPLALSTYKIEYDKLDVECTPEPEIIYEDDNYYYCLPCMSSYNVYLVWDDGTKELLKNAINNKKVNIPSLKNSGLEIVKYEK